MQKRFRDIFGSEKVVIGEINLVGDTAKDKAGRGLEELMIYIGAGFNNVLVRDLNPNGSLDGYRFFLRVLDSFPVETNIGINIPGDYLATFDITNRHNTQFVYIEPPSSGYLDSKKYSILRDNFKGVVLGGIDIQRFRALRITLRREAEYAEKHFKGVVAIGGINGRDKYLERLSGFRNSLNGCSIPLISGAMVDPETVASHLRLTRGVIAGDYFRGGNPSAPIDKEKVKRFVGAVRGK